MKVRKEKASRGSALLIALVAALVLAIALGSYLVYTNVQTLLVRRAQQWNAAMAITEAGIEEALAHLNNRAPFIDFEDATNRLATDNWVQIAPNKFRGPTRYFAGGYYEATITLVWPGAQIDSVGYAPAGGVFSGGL